MERLPLIGGTTLIGQHRTTTLPDPPTPLDGAERLRLLLAAQVIADDVLVIALTRRLRQRVEEQELRHAS